MGAEIIRQQLSAEGSGNVSRYRGEAAASNKHQQKHNHNRKHQHQHQHQHHDHFAGNGMGGTRIDRDDWDPWRTDSNEEGGHTDPETETDTVDDPEDNHYGDDNDEEDDADTMEILEFANAIIDKYKSPRSKPLPQSRTPIPKKSEPSTNSVPKMDRPKRGGSRSSGSYGCLVQRVSEMEDSSLASSSVDTGYLPKNLINGLGCGSLANAVIPEEEVPEPLGVTAAAAPYENMVSPRSPEHDRLLEDPAYRHALRAGTLWQSLCSQHVRFPATWWDGKEPAGPPLGCARKFPWSYLGRHRVQADCKLNVLIGNRGSSGRILLHLVVRDVVSGEPIEDIACGCYHPNARGVRRTKDYDPRAEDCRDVWIAHRRRSHKKAATHDDDDDGDEDDKDDEYSQTTIESILRHQNKGRVDVSPLGPHGGNSRSSVTNQNLKAVFGSKPPVYTVFCLESELYELFQSRLDGSIPASVALLRHYLRYRIG
eukprot:jgi/Psemu1/323515/estExt_fgenesh1_pg.C_750027